jgi:hypothetical protein
MEVQNLGHYSSDLAPKDYEQPILLGANYDCHKPFYPKNQKDG